MDNTLFFPLLLAIGLPLLLGWAVMRFFWTSATTENFFLRLAMAYGLGMGLLAQWILILGILKIRFSLATIVGPLLGGSLFLLYFVWRRSRTRVLPTVSDCPGCVAERATSSLLNISLLIFICMNSIYVFWVAWNIPLYEWDSIATHAFNAKVLFYERSLLWQKNFPHGTYPLQVPFMQMWIGICLGRWDDQLLKFFAPWTFLSYLTMQYFLVKRMSSRRWGLIGLCLLLSANFFTFQASTAYRDFTMMYYNCGTMLLLLFWLQDKKNHWITFAGLFAGFGSFTKMEGAGYLLIQAIVWTVIVAREPGLRLRQRWEAWGRFLAPAAGIALIYFAYKQWILLPQISSKGFDLAAFDLAHIQVHVGWEYLPRIGVVIHRFLVDLLLSGNWNYLWPLLWICLLNIDWESRRREIPLLLGSLGLYFLVYLAGYSFSQHYSWVANDNAALSRSILHFFPLAVLLIIFILAPKKSS